MDFVGKIPDFASTSRLRAHCNDNSHGACYDENTLGDEEPLEFVGWNKQDGKLDCPENEVADHSLRSDAGAFGDVVRDVKIGRPDRPDDLCHSCRAGICLNGMPEQGSNSSCDDSKPRKVPSK